MYKSLRSFTSELERAGRLKRIAAPVDKDTEIAGIARWVIECVPPHDLYALQFDNVKGYSTPVVVGLFSTRDFYAAALGIEAEQILRHWSQAVAHRVPTKLIDDGPILEDVRTVEADLTKIPIPTWTPGRDGGPYIPSGGVITKDFETGIQNLGVYRLQQHDSKRLGLFFGSDKQHGAMHLAKYRKANQPMPVAIVIGGSPAVSFAAAAKTVYGVDELEIAGGLAGQPIDVVRGRTVDLLVPADAEYVVEGYVHPDTLELEGPFGEAYGFMNRSAPAPVVDVSAICSRKDAWFHGYVQQLPPSEGHFIWEYGLLGPLWYYLRERLGLPALVDMAIAPGAAGLSMLAVQVDGGAKEVRRVLDAIATLNFGQKVVVAVDRDIDIRDPQSLNWAMSTKVDPEQDVRILKNVQTYLLDPSILARNSLRAEDAPPGPFASSMMLLDATQKCRVPEISLPGKTVMRHVLDRWIDFGLPPLNVRSRLTRLLETHSESDLYFDGNRSTE
jgi:UbiD family decarboxylase